MKDQVRAWKIPHRVGAGWKELAELVNPVVRGWYGYYGRFGPTVMRQVIRAVNRVLMVWMRAKWRRLRSWNKARKAWQRVCAQWPWMFWHWRHETYAPAW
jgi:hypothetical protein